MPETWGAIPPGSGQPGWDILADDGTEDGYLVAQAVPTEEAARKICAVPGLIGLARAVLLWHRPMWGDEERSEWTRLTGQEEATSRSLCDFARQVLAKTEGK